MGRQTKKGNDRPPEQREEGAPDLARELEELRAEREDLHERLQRAAADYQNLKRRGLTESDERLRRAMQPLLDKMLIVLDYLDMALACPTTTDEAKNLAVGVRLTRDQFLQALEQEDVRVVPSTDTFDPTMQEAKAAIERDDVPPGTVLETVRSGYTWRGEILRYAQVVVSKAPAEPGAEPRPEPEA
jgi:molecular chaperone GrpE